jgi:hypothetical protein
VDEEDEFRPLMFLGCGSGLVLFAEINRMWGRQEGLIVGGNRCEEVGVVVLGTVVIVV